MHFWRNSNFSADTFIKVYFFTKKIAIRSGKSFYLIILDGNLLFEQILNLSKMVTFKSFLDLTGYAWFIHLEVASNMSKVLLFSLVSEISETTFLTLGKKEKNEWLIFSHNYWFRKFFKPVPILDGFENFWNHFPKKGCVSND